jgi:FkbH-like protein
MNDKIELILDPVRKSPAWLAYRRAAEQVRSLLQSDSGFFANHLRIALVGSFTLDPLADFLTVEAAAEGIGLEICRAPYAQVSSEILNADSGLYAFRPEVTFLAAEHQSLAGDPLAAADQLTALAQAWKANTDQPLVICNFIAAPDWPLHAIASERQQQIRQANQRLTDAFAGDRRIHVLDLDALAAFAGYANAYSPQMAAMARVPFSEAFLKLFSQLLCSHIKAVKGWAKKCLVLDCDNTLWGGIIGEDGMEGIALGPDWPGREFVEFQKAILELYEQGVILAVNSKNNENDVLEVFRRHRHMVLKEEHIAAFAVNWQTKAENMQQLALQLNIGLDSMVFLDDNPAERQIIRQMLPQIEIVDLPANPALYADTLRRTSFFTKLNISDEDRRRGRMYAANRQRDQLQKTSVSLQDYLKSLEMVCTIRHAQSTDIKRAAQLTQRTNQFNLTTRRYTESQVQDMLESPGWNVYVLGLKDKFGDSGTVGLALVEKQQNTWRIDTFLMSCRVIGRQAEEALLDTICKDAITAGAATLDAEYIPTEKNTIVAGFWDKMQFTRISTEPVSACRMDLKNYSPKTFEYLKIE